MLSGTTLNSQKPPNRNRYRVPVIKMTAAFVSDHLLQSKEYLLLNSSVEFVLISL